MDTDELTAMAYETITLAYHVSENLRAELGAFASAFPCEDDYLRGVISFFDEILSDPEGYLDSWNLLNETSIPSFSKGVGQLRDHVLRTLKTPCSERGGTACA